MVAGLGVLVGCGPEAARPPVPPDILLIVIDTLRADHLGAYGYPRPTSPIFDSLAADGTLFSNATASSSWTRPSMATLFTSRLPSEHGAVSSLAPLDAGIPTLAERLRDAGYLTVGVTGNFPHVNDASGLSRGFERFHVLSAPAQEAGEDPLLRMPIREGGTPAPLRAPTAAEVNQRVDEALASRDGRPLFLYVHYMDPHSGYLAPARFQSRFRSTEATGPVATSDFVVDLAAGRIEAPASERQRLVDLYDAEIAYVDWQIGLLLKRLVVRKIVEAAVIVVLSDHGEEFADHGGWFHGMTLHREMLRVPLLVRGAPQLEPGVRDDPVALLDVPTTLLALAGVPPPEGMRGRVLWDLEGPPPSRIAELHPDAVREERAGPIRDRVALDAWPWKVVVDRSNRVSVYQLEDDPAERTPLPAADPSAPRDLIARARERALAVAKTVEPIEPSGAERDALRALGYAD